MKNKIVNNSIWMMFSSIYSMIVGLVATMFISRYLGPANLGILDYAISIATIFAGIASLGLPSVIANDLVKNPENEDMIMSTSIFIRFSFSLFLYVLSIATIFIFTGGSRLYLIIGSMCSFSIISGITDLFSQYFIVHYNSKKFVIVKCITFTIYAILRYVGVIMEQSVEFFAFLVLFDALLFMLSVFVVFWLTKRRHFKIQIDFNYAKITLQRSSKFLVASIFSTIYLKIDQVMIGTFLPDKAQLGFYSSAVRIAELWVFVPLSIINSFTPNIIAAYNAGVNKYKEKLSKLCHLISITGLAAIAVISVFSTLFILIIYGEAYLPSKSVLLIILWMVWIGQLGNIHSIWIVASGKEKYLIHYSIFGAMINIVLNLIMIPILGIIGAAIASVTTSIFTNFILYLLIKDTNEMGRLCLKSYLFIDVIERIFIKKKN